MAAVTVPGGGFASLRSGQSRAMTPHEPAVEPREHRRLVERVAHVEHVVLSALASLTAVLLATGLVVRVAGETDDDRPEATNLLQAGFQAFETDVSPPLGDSALLGGFLLALLAVTLTAFWALAVVSAGSVSLLRARLVHAIGVLLLLAGVGALCLAISAGSDEELYPGPGGPIFALGAFAFAALLWGPTRRWWDPVWRVSEPAYR